MTAHDTPSTNGMQRSLRQCLSNMAALLFRQGHVLETVTVPHRGLNRSELKSLGEADRDWAPCQHILETSQAATWNDQQRFVLTGLGRELLFDMFGEGAADCA
ncbi:hypothetical protein FHR95_000774 [Halomonas fontilapidosi]|uniref:Uncharacterized protein n=1 Tax=Halomonas fontilapidosi TaxID=616675 RepID=A0A7W5DIH9_9GAMM|nr:hypothetical protein [Halomonas fontilapidosi]MBB3183233.1 hypothetical protein [Halomonas fontilapidosi]